MLAASRSEDPTSLVRQARWAELHCLNVTHDLEANGFVVDLSVASSDSLTRALPLGRRSSHEDHRPSGTQAGGTVDREAQKAPEGGQTLTAQ